MRVAVIGTGISGNLVARILASEHEVEVFEANDYVGGHSNTVDIETLGQRFQVDTGFMVFNGRTYPNFSRLLKILGVESQESDMSFSVRCNRSGLEYQGSSFNGLFAQRTNLIRPGFHRMLRDIMRFNRIATRAVDNGELDNGATVGEFVRSCRVDRAFTEQYLVPMAAAIWSSEAGNILEFPAKFMIGFCRNHGLLQLRDRPQWKTIVGGARSYVEKLIDPIRGRIRLNCPVASVSRGPDYVQVATGGGPTERFDQVVFATHADQTLALLADATRSEIEVLQSFPYQRNRAVLHTDTSLLPRNRRAWASWNYAIPRDQQQTASVTYDLSRLQNLDSASPILLTLNPAGEIAGDKTIRTFRYDHPAYSRASIDAQARHMEISGVQGTHFCGAYWGYGFHEDGVNSAINVAHSLGITS